MPVLGEIQEVKADSVLQLLYHTNIIKMKYPSEPPCHIYPLYFIITGCPTPGASLVPYLELRNGFRISSSNH